jgi:PIN domain nuclease of toxin-antitoxin system
VIVLDTHIWIWYLDNPELLSERAREVVDRARDDAAIRISSISTWELFMLESRGRLRLRIPVLEWLRKSERLSFLDFVPVDNDIARLAVQLPEYPHQDPADRLIIATALSLGAPVVTKDRNIQQYERVPTVW